MQFTGHSLPVHQSMSVPWEFFLPRPISSANFHPRDFLASLPLECVTPFRCITLNGIFGRVEGQNTTLLYYMKSVGIISLSVWIGILQIVAVSYFSIIVDVSCSILGFDGIVFKNCPMQVSYCFVVAFICIAYIFGYDQF